jgi:hypothetical protein
MRKNRTQSPNERARRSLSEARQYAVDPNVRLAFNIVLEWLEKEAETNAPDAEPDDKIIRVEF